MKMLLFMMTMSAASAAIYDGQTGSRKVDLFVDNCWTNLTFGIEGKRAMVITTSYGEPLENGEKTGVCLQEAADPYYIYLDSGADVDIVSIKGGQIPYDTKPKTKNVRRFLDDKSAMSKLNNSTALDDVNFDDYDLVFMAGGWGAAFDLPTSDVLGQKVAKALATGKPMIASTCHGALGFARANRTDGTPYIKGVKMTGVTDKQIEKLGIEKYTPYHPENTLKELGADYQCIHGTSILFGDVAATSTSVGYVHTTNESDRGTMQKEGENKSDESVKNEKALLDKLKCVLPKSGILFSEKSTPTEVLCKPKIMPLKSSTQKKLEELDKVLRQGGGGK